MSDPQAELSQFLSTVTTAEIPSSTRTKAAHHLLDTVGAIVVGADSDVVTTSLATMRSVYGNTGDTPLLISGESPLASLPAAFIHGISAHAREVDDSGGCDHSGATTLPALISALEHAPASISGRDFLSAFIVGYEASRRVQSALGGYDVVNERGWHSTGVCGVFGAAAASARVLNLPPAAFSRALGIAGSYAGGTWAFMDNNASTKKVHVGRACELGLSAALLAHHGMSGPNQVFTATWGGILETYMEGGATDAAELTRQLGSEWMIDRASIKPYATCRSTHSTVDTLRQLCGERGVRPENIAAVRILCSDLLLRMCGAKGWTTVEAAQMSVVAAATAFLRWGAVGPVELAALVAGDAEAECIRERIVAVRDGRREGTEEPALVVELVDGGVIRIECPDPSGGPTNPLSAADIESKFRNLTAGRLTPPAQDEVIRTVTRMDEIPDVRDAFHGIKAEMELRHL